MSNSPFHGIFSAFAQNQDAFAASKRATPLRIEDESMPSLQSPPTPLPVQNVGQIAVDIYEQEGYYIVRAPIAGIRLSDLDIEVDGKILTIRGIRNQTEDIPSNQYYIQECFWGEFSRSITLPCTIDPKKVKATFSKDSILKILVPKEEKIKVVRINEG